jgi:ABC-type nickel/cobalt efflux system permease component RcnA
VKAAASLTISCGEAIREVLKGLKKLLKKKRVDGKQNTLVVLMFLEEGIVHAIEPFGYLQSIHLNKDAQDAISESIE